MHQKGNALSTFLVILFVVYLLTPLLFTIIYSVCVDWNDTLPTAFTLRHYADLFSNNEFWQSLSRSVIISLISVSICLSLLLLAMYVVVVHLPGLERYMQILVTIPYAISGVILSTSLLSLYAAAPWPFSDRMFMLVFAYCVVILPYMFQGIRNSFYTINVARLLEAAEVLGASKFKSYWTVIVPNIMSGITVSVLLSIGIIFGDFALVNTIAGTKFVTLQFFLYKAFNKSGGRAASIVIVQFLITLTLSFTVLYLQTRKKVSKPKKLETKEAGI